MLFYLIIFKYWLLGFVVSIPVSVLNEFLIQCTVAKQNWIQTNIF